MQHVHNTLSRKLEEFKPLKEGKIGLYVCGVTPYDHLHLGHARTYVAFDIIRRFLEFSGYTVMHVQNVTDVDDKIIRRAKETKQNPLELSTHFDILSRQQLAALNVLPAHHYPKVTQHIPHIINFIEKLISRGFAYIAEDGVYFEVAKFPPYGRLSGQDLAEIRRGARIEVNEKKKAPEDFALWKAAKEGELCFGSPWGAGRPGWHIECSAMAAEYLGQTIDIHGGARDLIFPHHENEIAQSESASGKQFVRYWMHTGFLTVNGEKMAKSLGNFVTVSDVMSKFDKNGIRMFFCQTHYTSPIDYSEASLSASQQGVNSLLGTLDRIEEKIGGNKKAGKKAAKESGEAQGALSKTSQKSLADFIACMQNDFDVPNAIAFLFALSDAANRELASSNPDAGGLSAAMEAMQKMLGILGIEKIEIPLAAKEKELASLAKKYGIADSDAKSADEIAALLLNLRSDMRTRKDFAASDTLRADLSAIGIALEDAKDGKTRLKVVK
jgi:cysteinyl-tRNA synthetase